MTSSNSSSVKSSSISFRISFKKKTELALDQTVKLFYPKFFDAYIAGTGNIKNPKICMYFKCSNFYCIHGIYGIHV